MSYNSTVHQDLLVAPVRTYDQVVAIMRAKGDEKITRQHIYYYEQSAFRKLRAAMPEYEDYFD